MYAGKKGVALQSKPTRESAMSVRGAALHSDEASMGKKKSRRTKNKVLLKREGKRRQKAIVARGSTVPLQAKKKIR